MVPDTQWVVLGFSTIRWCESNTHFVESTWNFEFDPFLGQ